MENISSSFYKSRRCRDVSLPREWPYHDAQCPLVKAITMSSNKASSFWNVIYWFVARRWSLKEVLWLLSHLWWFPIWPQMLWLSSIPRILLSFWLLPSIGSAEVTQCNFHEMRPLMMLRFLFPQGNEKQCCQLKLWQGYVMLGGEWGEEKSSPQRGWTDKPPQGGLPSSSSKAPEVWGHLLKVTKFEIQLTALEGQRNSSLKWMEEFHFAWSRMRWCRIWIYEGGGSPSFPRTH